MQPHHFRNLQQSCNNLSDPDRLTLVSLVQLECGGREPARTVMKRLSEVKRLWCVCNELARPPKIALTPFPRDRAV